MVIDPLASATAAQQAGLQRALRQLTLEKEQYIRLCVILTRFARGDIEALPFSPDGTAILIPREMFEAVPQNFTIDVQQIKLQEDRDLRDGEEEIPFDDLLALAVTRKKGSNGHLQVPTRSRLVLP